MMTCPRTRPRTRPRPFAIVTLVTIPALALPAGAADEAAAARIGELLDAYDRLDLFDGAVLVAEAGEVIYEGGVGYANVEWRIPNAPDTRFRLGSITKQFTAMLVMQLVVEGAIDLEAPMSTYLPDYRRDIGERVTVHHLLTHTSGIPSYTGQPGFMQNETREAWEPAAFVEKHCSGDLEFEPGSTFRYNNSGYFLLGLIIETVSGQTYEEALHERILEPLGMDHTGYDRHADIIPHRAAGYERRFDGVVNARYLDMTIPYAAGSMYSTVRDLHTWDRALYTEKLLPVAARERQFEPFLNGYGYGWSIREEADGEGGTTRLVSHGGGINGFNTIIVRLVDREQLVVLLSNHGGAPLQEMARQIRRILAGREYEMPDPPLDRALARTAIAAGVDRAVELYEARQAARPQNPQRVERSLNDIGYALLGQERTADAIAVFRLNVALFPDAFNTWDSLAEALAANGEREAAVEHYEKSLALNPDNENAVTMLKGLREPVGAGPSRR